MGDEYVGVSEAAGFLGVSPRRVRQLAQSGALRARRIGNSWAIPTAEISKRSHRQPSPGRPASKNSAWELAALADAIAPDVARRLKDGFTYGPLLQQQGRVAQELADSIAELCAIDPFAVVDNPPSLDEVRSLSSRAVSLARRDELLIRVMGKAVGRLNKFDSLARVDPRAISDGWLQVLATESPEAMPDPAALKKLRDRLPFSHDPSERNRAAMRNRYDHAAYFYSHPSLINEVLLDETLAVSGAHAAARYGLDLVPGDSVDAYLSADRAGALVAQYSLQQSAPTRANVVLRIVEELPKRHPPVAPRLFVALDLLENDDPRGRRAGSGLLEGLSATISMHHLLSERECTSSYRS